MMTTPFRDRDDAGARLAEQLRDKSFVEPVVLALPRGGVPVASHVADAIGAPLDVIVARKIGAPTQDEFGIGAVAEGLDTPVFNPAASQLGITADTLNRLVARAYDEVARRMQRYRGGRPLPVLSGRDVILVDDGLATGVTAEAALRAARQERPHRLWFAAPVCAIEPADRLAELADELLCISSPPALGAIGGWYEDFAQTTDDQVVEILSSRQPGPPAS